MLANSSILGRFLIDCLPSKQTKIFLFFCADDKQRTKARNYFIIWISYCIIVDKQQLSKHKTPHNKIDSKLPEKKVLFKFVACI